MKMTAQDLQITVDTLKSSLSIYGDCWRFTPEAREETLLKMQSILATTEVNFDRPQQPE